MNLEDKIEDAVISIELEATKLRDGFANTNYSSRYSLLISGEKVLTKQLFTPL